MDIYELILDIIAPALFLYYGWKFRYQTPPFGSKDGLSTKYSRKSEEAWIAANKFGGLLLIATGALLFASLAANYIIFGREKNALMTYISLGVGLFLAVILIPLVNAKLKKQFGE